MAGRRFLITCMRDEGPFIIEWVAYHRMIGFTDILIYTNDCTDGTDEICDRLAALGLVTHFRNEDYEDKGPQWSALKHAWKNKELRQAEWVLPADVDEFVNIHVGDGHLDDLLNSVPEADFITLQWRFFGNNGVADFVDQPVIAQFTHSSAKRHRYPLIAVMCKTLVRPQKIKKLGVHIPRMDDMSSTLREHGWYSGNGQRLAPPFNPRYPIMQASTDGYELAQLNHYALRSVDSIMVKAGRGLPNHRRKAVDLHYCARRNFNNAPELSIQRHLPALKERMDEILADATLGPLHRQACDKHLATAKAARDSQDGITHYASLLIMDGVRELPPQLENMLLHEQMRLNQRAKNQGNDKGSHY